MNRNKVAFFVNHVQTTVNNTMDKIFYKSCNALDMFITFFMDTITDTFELLLHILEIICIAIGFSITFSIYCIIILCSCVKNVFKHILRKNDDSN